MTPEKTIVIGGGLAGLSAAVALAEKGANVPLMEAAGQAGGRCRSYFDSTLGMRIDNGNHLVLSGNHATFKYLRMIGAENRMTGPEHARFTFTDLENGERWDIAPNAGPLAWWVLSGVRRVPGTSAKDYASLVPLMMAGAGKRVCDVVRCDGALWHKLLRPFLLAALNTAPEEGSAALAGAIIRETLAKGGRHYRPRIATPDLAAAFVTPALEYLKAHGADVQLGARVRGLVRDDDHVIALANGDVTMPVSRYDKVILAVPPWTAGELLPGIAAPDEFCAIINAHFKIAPPANAPAMLGVINGTAEWIFTFEDRIAVTVSAADAIVDKDREELAKLIWADVAKALDMQIACPIWQIVKEKRATFAATPEQAERRAPAQTAWKNLFLAGDWTDTGLPATIEGAIRSGFHAAQLAGRV
jgi:squalene-associated FAD-dependent desaturase